jgi:hypothetical protein
MAKVQRRGIECAVMLIETSRANSPLRPHQISLSALRAAALAYWSRLSRRFGGIGFPLLVFTVSRAAVFAVSWMALYEVSEPLTGLNSDRTQVLFAHPALDAMCRWDCWHYINIAKSGFQNAIDTNFWPLFPWTVRAVAWLLHCHLHYAAMLVPQLACLGSYIVIYKLFRRIEGENAARWALLAFAAYPFSFFQSAGYPESMMVLFTALATRFACLNKHIAAGIALSAALMSRHLGLTAGASLLVLHVLFRGFKPKYLLWTPKILGLAIPWLVLGVWSLFCAHKFGDPISYLHARDKWGAGAWYSVLEAFRNDDHRIKVWFYISLIPAAGALALLGNRRRWGLAPFALVLMGTMYAVGAAGLGRYSASCWPAFLPIGAWLSRRPLLGPPALAGLALVQGLWLYLYAHQWAVL